MKFLSISLIVVCLFSAVFAEEITVNKTCESYSVQDITLYNETIVGDWYIRGKYGKQENCSRFEINLLEVKNRTDNDTNLYSCTAQIKKIKEEPFNLTLNIANGNLAREQHNTTITGKILKVKENNDTYLLWTCSTINETSSNQTLVVLSRDATKNISSSLNTTLSENSLNPELLQINDQTSCESGATNVLLATSLLFITLATIKVI